MTARWVSQAILGALLLAALVMSIGGQRPRQPEQPLIIKSTFGKDLYDFYCARCHGLDGKGNESAPGLATPPPDLTTLSLRNGGTFPRERVRATITEGAPTSIPAHGTRDMPAWGRIFRAFDPSDTLVEIRIENLVRYVEAMQEQWRGSNRRSGSAHVL